MGPVRNLFLISTREKIRPHPGDAGEAPHCLGRAGRALGGGGHPSPGHGAELPGRRRRGGARHLCLRRRRHPLTGCCRAAGWQRRCDPLHPIGVRATIFCGCSARCLPLLRPPGLLDSPQAGGSRYDATAAGPSMSARWGSTPASASVRRTFKKQPLVSGPLGYQLSAVRTIAQGSTGLTWHTHRRGRVCRGRRYPHLRLQRPLLWRG